MGEHQFNPRARHTRVVRAAIARDMYQRVLEPGDLVKIQGLKDFDPVFQVHDIQPNLHPQAPPNSVTVRLSAPLVLIGPADQPDQRLIRVATADEVGTKPAEGEAPAGAGGLAPTPLVGEDREGPKIVE